MGLGFVIPLVAMQVTLYTENLYFSYVPLIPLILTVAVWGVRRGMVAVSNRVLVLLLLIAVVSVRIHGAPWLSFGSLFMDAPTVLLIAVLPHLAGRLDFSRLATSRMFCYNVLVALVVFKIYLAMDVSQDVLLETGGELRGGRSVPVHRFFFVYPDMDYYNRRGGTGSPALARHGGKELAGTPWLTPILSFSLYCRK